MEDFIWQFQTEGYIRGSPRLGADMAYIGSDDGYVYALDAASGEVSWRFEAGASYYSSPFPAGGSYYSSPFPTVVDGAVYVGSADGNVYALDAGSGELHWRFEAEDEVSVHQAVVDGTVYATSAGGHVYALDADTGELHWRYSIGLRSHPYLAISGMIFVGGGRGTLHALDSATGEVRWGLQRGIYQIFPALVVKDVLYAVSGDGHAYAFDVFTGKLAVALHLPGGPWLGICADGG